MQLNCTVLFEYHFRLPTRIHIFLFANNDSTFNYFIKTTQRIVLSSVARWQRKEIPTVKHESTYFFPTFPYHLIEVPTSNFQQYIIKGAFTCADFFAEREFLKIQNSMILFWTYKQGRLSVVYAAIYFSRLFTICSRFFWVKMVIISIFIQGRIFI